MSVAEWEDDDPPPSQDAAATRPPRPFSAGVLDSPLAVEMAWLQQQGGRFRAARKIAEQLRSALDCDEVRDALDAIPPVGGSKTRGARRDIVLLPALADLLREHRRKAFQRGIARQADFVFASCEGTPLGYRNLAQRGLRKAADRAGLNPEGQPQLTLHDLRHTFGSHLVRQGADVVSVSRQMGHARPSITLDIYSHEFAEVQHRATIASKLTEAFSGILVVSDT